MERERESCGDVVITLAMDRYFRDCFHKTEICAIIFFSFFSSFFLCHAHQVKTFQTSQTIGYFFHIELYALKFQCQLRTRDILHV